MKKAIATLLMLGLTVSMVSGCGSKVEQHLNRQQRKKQPQKILQMLRIVVRRKQQKLL